MGSVAKAIAAGLVALIAYFVGVIPESGGFADLTTVQWLSAAASLLAAYGVVWQVPNSPPSS